jgi:hypothetical protein
METAASLSNDVGKKAACEALSIPRSTFYRRMNPPEVVKEDGRPAPPLALSETEQQQYCPSGGRMMKEGKNDTSDRHLNVEKNIEM